MVFETVSDFLTMGGHGVYVWSAYTAAFLVVLYNLVSPVLARKKLMLQLQRQIKLDSRQSRVVTAQYAAHQERVTEQVGHSS